MYEKNDVGVLISMARDRLDGWSEIAAYLEINPRTAQRYEKDRDLPVRRRPQGGPKSPVFAFKSELDSWLKDNEPELKSSGSGGRSSELSSNQDLSGPILARISKLSNLTLYRRDYFLRFVLHRTREGVRANLECRYQVCNATNERQSFVQELTVDDPDHGYVEEMSFLVDQKPIYFLKRPSVAERCLGYSIYRGRELTLEPISAGVTYECRARWVLNRSEDDFWNTHMVLPTIGITVETQAPPDFDITSFFSTPDLVMTGEHLDVGWNRKR